MLGWHPEDGGDDPEDPGENRWEDCELLEGGMVAFGERVLKETKARARLVQARRMRTVMVTVTLEVEVENQRLNNSAFTTSTLHLNP